MHAYLETTKKLALSIICSLLMVSGSVAQSDSVFSFQEFFDLVKSNHPIAKQADLMLLQGDAKLLNARGNFDPTVEADIQQKYFEQEQYYSLLNGVLTVPTWYGIAIENGFQQNLGTKLDPENSTPDAGLWFLGVSLSLGQGLALDQRRAVLRQAKLFKQQTRADRAFLLNELLFEASQAYYHWQFTFERMSILQNAVQLAAERLDGVKGSILGGDSPAIDSIEAIIQWRSRQQLLQQAELEFQNARSALSIHLWNDQEVPLEITVGAHPDALDVEHMASISENLLEQELQNHPKLISNQLKIASLDIDQRWSKEQLKPIIDLKYRPITEGINYNPLAAINTEDYVWGLSIKSPLFLRKARSEVRMAEVRVEEAKLANAQDQQAIKINSQIALDSWRGYTTQIEQLTDVVQRYEQLLGGERILFQQGESSLFLLNARESSLVDSQLKRLEVIIKRKVAKIKLYREAGMLAEIS